MSLHDVRKTISRDDLAAALAVIREPVVIQRGLSTGTAQEGVVWGEPEIVGGTGYLDLIWRALPDRTTHRADDD